MRHVLAWWVVLVATQAAAASYVALPGGQLRTALPPDGKQALAIVKPFLLRTAPVTNAEFARFTVKHAQWQRDKVPTAFADAQYLKHWPDNASPNLTQQNQPVTNVSWFAAQAYCESEGARLPSWHEWEYAAAADEKRSDARDDLAWRERILAWYSHTSSELPAVGASTVNFYGVADMHGVIWEWVDDFAAMMVSGDSRNQGDPELAQFCGAGALSANDRENYPVLMRMALLSSLSAASTTRNLGFRCAKDAPASLTKNVLKGKK
jgi:formylglycine-generating enzyme